MNRFQKISINVIRKKKYSYTDTYGIMDPDKPAPTITSGCPPLFQNMIMCCSDERCYLSVAATDGVMAQIKEPSYYGR